MHFKDVLICLTTQAIKSSMGGDLDHLKQSIKMADDTAKKTLASGATVVTQYKGAAWGKMRAHGFQVTRILRRRARATYLTTQQGDEAAMKARQEYMEKHFPNDEGTKAHGANSILARTGGIVPHRNDREGGRNDSPASTEPRGIRRGGI